jgi:hypothetical protein
MQCIDFHRKKKQALAVRLPSYTLPNILLRLFFISIVAVGVVHLIKFAVEPNSYPQKPAWEYYLMAIISFSLAAEFQILFDNILERFLPVPQKLRLRISIQLFAGLLMLFVLSKSVSLFFDPQALDASTRSAMFMGLVMGLLFVQIIATSLAFARFTQKWFDTQEEMAEMKREKLRMDYNSLQDQLNPHFLFNNLSVLKSLIIYDPKAAVGFTENFTDVYRYVLQSKDKRLVRLSEEVEFIKSYIGIHKERLGDGLDVTLSGIENSAHKEIAPLTLQLLVENAIKHNVTSKETPLRIEIFADDESLTVRNNLNLKTSSYSTHTGLSNMVRRYEMLTEKEMVVQQNDERFEVIVPLM